MSKLKTALITVTIGTLIGGCSSSQKSDVPQSSSTQQHSDVPRESYIPRASYSAASGIPICIEPVPDDYHLSIVLESGKNQYIYGNIDNFHTITAYREVLALVQTEIADGDTGQIHISYYGNPVRFEESDSLEKTVKTVTVHDLNVMGRTYSFD